MWDVPAWLNASGMFASGMVAIAVWYHALQQRRDTHLQIAQTALQLFWEHRDFRQVRAWISCDAAYTKVACVLILRRRIYEHQALPHEMDEKTYTEFLDKLDKFFNLVLRVILLFPKYETFRPKMGRFIDAYWLYRIMQTDRLELQWYMEKFYPEVYSIAAQIASNRPPAGIEPSPHEEPRDSNESFSEQDTIDRLPLTAASTTSSLGEEQVPAGCSLSKGRHLASGSKRHLDLEWTQPRRSWPVLYSLAALLALLLLSLGVQRGSKKTY